MLRTSIDWGRASSDFALAQPFNHIVFDDFFLPDVAEALAAECPAYDAPAWYSYDNAIENKKAMNQWDRFGPVTYRVMTWLNSAAFINHLEQLTSVRGLVADIGLNGGGWHAHGRGGKLNVHVDYSIHPKLGLERRLNLIVYLSAGWDPAWGGGLGLWTHDADADQPRALEKTVDCKFNRAIIFDTTQNSWHGLPDPIACPAGMVRQSLAVYYLSEPRAGANPRGKALFAPHHGQKDDPDVLDLIRKRASVTAAAETYRKG